MRLRSTARSAPPLVGHALAGLKIANVRPALAPGVPQNVATLRGTLL
jgi:hypothetical protein